MERMSTPIGSYAPDFELPGTDGAVHHLAQYLRAFRAVVVVFMCNQCPHVQLYLDRLKQLQADFQAQGMTLIGINPNDAAQLAEDSFENMKRFAADQQLNFPYLRDVTQDVAQSFGVERTPHVFLLDQDGILCYRGGIDDSPNDSTAVKADYLRDAIASLLAGEPIAPAQTDPVGCPIKWRR